MQQCTLCGSELVHNELVEGVCFKCKNSPAYKDEAQVAIEAKQRQYDERLASIILTTEAYPIGLDIQRRIDIITAECAFGMNIFRDFFAGVTDIVGGRSQATQKVLRDARTRVIGDLRLEALEAGADAVVGVSLTYTELAGKDKSILLVVATGTAVQLADGKTAF